MSLDQAALDRWTESVVRDYARSLGDDEEALKEAWRKYNELLEKYRDEKNEN